MVHIKIGPIGYVLLASDYKFLVFLLTHNKLLTKSINLIQKESVEVLHGYTKSVINSKRKELEETRKEGNYSDVDDLGRKKKKVFLDLILEATVDGQSLSDKEIREEVDTLCLGYINISY
jgi:hypothetical protein